MSSRGSRLSANALGGQTATMSDDTLTQRANEIRAELRTLAAKLKRGDDSELVV